MCFFHSPRRRVCTILLACTFSPRCHTRLPKAGEKEQVDSQKTGFGNQEAFCWLGIFHVALFQIIILVAKIDEILTIDRLNLYDGTNMVRFSRNLSPCTLPYGGFFCGCARGAPRGGERLWEWNERENYIRSARALMRTQSSTTRAGILRNSLIGLCLTQTPYQRTPKGVTKHFQLRQSVNCFWQHWLFLSKATMETIVVQKCIKVQHYISNHFQILPLLSPFLSKSEYEIWSERAFFIVGGRSTQCVIIIFVCSDCLILLFAQELISDRWDVRMLFVLSLHLFWW